MKYKLVKDMTFFDEGKHTKLRKGSVYAEVSKKNMTRDMYYRKSKYEKREQCKVVILMARNKWRFFKIGTDVVSWL